MDKHLQEIKLKFPTLTEYLKTVIEEGHPKDDAPKHFFEGLNMSDFILKDEIGQRVSIDEDNDFQVDISISTQAYSEIIELLESYGIPNPEQLTNYLEDTSRRWIYDTLNFEPEIFFPTRYEPECDAEL